jgi:hypothetical protein
MRSGRDRRSENPRWVMRGKSACFCLGPISGSHQGQRSKRPHSKAGYMTAPERFVDSKIPLAPRAPSIHGPMETYLQSPGRSPLAHALAGWRAYRQENPRAVWCAIRACGRDHRASPDGSARVYPDHNDVGFGRGLGFDFGSAKFYYAFPSDRQRTSARSSRPVCGEGDEHH